MLDRLMYWPPWTLTNWWLPRFFRGCDEHHNLSVAFTIPLLGCLIVFYERDFTRDGPEHAWAYGPDGIEGKVYPGCEICTEFLEDVRPLRSA